MTSLLQTIGFLISLSLIPISVYSEPATPKNLKDDKCFCLESQISVDVAVLNLANIFNDTNERTKAEQRLNDATQKYSEEKCGPIEFSTTRDHVEVKFNRLKKDY